MPEFQAHTSRPRDSPEHPPAMSTTRDPSPSESGLDVAADVCEQRRCSFSIRQLLTWTAFAACYFSIAANLPNTTKSITAGTLVAAVFVLIDLGRRQHPVFLMSIAFFACGLAYCVAAMFLTLVSLPDPTPPKPPMPFIAGAIYVISGEWFNDMVAEIGRLIAMILMYISLFSLLTVFSSVLAAVFFRRYSGWKLILANAPGLSLILYIVLGITWNWV